MALVPVGTYRVLAAFVLLTSISALKAQWKKDAYPDYLDVLDRLYGTYKVEEPGSTAKLAKMPDGWWLLFEGTDTVTARHQLWSSEKRKYLEPDLPKLARGEHPSPMGRWSNPLTIGQRVVGMSKVCC
jgi:hypothetical protein